MRVKVSVKSNAYDIEDDCLIQIIQLQSKRISQLKGSLETAICYLEWMNNSFTNSTSICRKLPDRAITELKEIAKG